VADLLNGPILRAVIGFAVPLTISNLVQQSYLLVDGVLVGQYLGIEGLAAVGVSQPLVYLASAVFIGISTGFSIRLAQVKGAGRAGELSASALGLAVFTVVWALSCTVLVALFARPILGLMGVSGQLVDDGRSFLLVFSLGFLPMFGTGAVCAYLRGLGNSKASMYILTVSSAVNAILAWVFIAPLGLGLRGAASATVVASVVSLALGLAYVRRLAPARDPAVPAGPRAAEIRAELRRAMSLGLPVAVQHVSLSLGIMVLIWVITPLGASFIAALTVVGRLELFTAMVFLDFSGALTVFTAQNLGAGQVERTRRGLRQVVGLAAGLTVLVSAVVMLLGPQIAAAFTEDRSTREMIVRVIMITYPFFFLYTVMAVIHGYFNGAGRTVLPLICTVLSFLVVRIPLSYVFREPYGADGVIWMVNVGWLAGFIFTVMVMVQHVLPRPAVREPVAVT
jgi:putative MATE family efflux protein